MKKKLTPDLKQLYEDYLNPEMQLSEIAKRYFMSRQSLHKIAKAQGWPARQARISDAEKQLVRDTLAANPNIPLTEVASRCEMPASKVRYLARKRKADNSGNNGEVPQNQPRPSSQAASEPPMTNQETATAVMSDATMTPSEAVAFLEQSDLGHESASLDGTELGHDKQ